MGTNQQGKQDSKEERFEQIFNKVSVQRLVESILDSDNESVCSTDTIDFWQWFETNHKNKISEH